MLSDEYLLQRANFVIRGRQLSQLLREVQPSGIIDLKIFGEGGDRMKPVAWNCNEQSWVAEAATQFIDFPQPRDPGAASLHSQAKDGSSYSYIKYAQPSFSYMVISPLTGMYTRQ